MREVVAEFERPVMLYSIGKDSSVLLRLAQKAFYPGPIPFPLLHIDTTYKFREMIEFRDRVHASDRRAADRPHQHGGDRRRHAAVRCRHAALLRAAEDQVAARRARGRQLRRGVRRRAARRGAVAREGADLLAARREGPVGSEESAARAVEPAERPHPPRREHPRVSALELDRDRRLAATSTSRTSRSCRSISPRSARSIVRGKSLIVAEQPFVPLLPGERPQLVMCRMRSLGCSPCTGAVRSDADTVPKIIEELIASRHSERQLRVIDHDQDGSMELKKREGYF